MTYRFQLEPYKGIKTRHHCPSCHQKRCFTKYIDIEKEFIFPEYVGRCDHEHRCGYHYTPKDYFLEHPEKQRRYTEYTSPKYDYTPPPLPSFIENELVEQSLDNYDNNNLFVFLQAILGEEATTKLFKRYYVGTSNHWKGATLFWQKDEDGNIRTGKIMLYDATNGKRVKEPFNHITWAHSLLKYKNYNLQQCFFGEHLLEQYPDKSVALVESEKTALIASHFMPQYLWLATGGKNGCLKEIH